MLKKNTAGQFVHFQGVDATTGGIKSGVTWTMRRCLDGTFAAGGATITEDGTTGWYKVALAQADTNGNNIGYNFTGTGAVPQTINVITTSLDPYDTVRGGMTALPNAAAEAAGGLYTRGTGAGQIAQDANGRVDVNVAAISTDATAADNAELMFDGTGYAGGTTKLDVNAVAISGDTTAADNAEAFFDGTGYAGTNNVIPSVTTVTGNVNGSVGSVTGAVGSVTGLVVGDVVTGSVNDAGATTTDFDGDGGLSSSDDFYNGSVLVFTSGTLKGIARRITDFVGTSRNLQFTAAFPTAPANSDTFEILGRID